MTSESLGLTATLDLAEISGQVAVPVEYRKGRPKHISMGPSAEDCGDMEQLPLQHAEAWPTDRIQVGLQAILLEDAGYTVREAVIYYAGKNSVSGFPSMMPSRRMPCKLWKRQNNARKAHDLCRSSMIRAVQDAPFSRYACRTRSTISAPSLQPTN